MSDRPLGFDMGKPIALSDNKRDRTATKHIPYNKN